MKKTNFDIYLEEQLKDKKFADRFIRAGQAWDDTLRITARRKERGTPHR